MMELNRRAMLAASAASVSLAAACTPEDQGQALHRALDQLATDLLRLSPEQATNLAASEAQAGGRYIDRLSDASKAAKAQRLSVVENALAQAGRIDRTKLSGQDAISLDVVRTAMENQAASLRYPYGAGAAMPYVVTQLYGAYISIPDFLDSKHPLTSPDLAEAYLARLRAYARQLDQESLALSEDAANGVMPPDFAIDKAIAQLSQFAARAPGDTVLVQSVRRRAADVAAIADKEALVARAEAIVAGEVLPAYRRQIVALQAIRPRAVHDAGVWRLPDGEAAYATALRNYTTTNMSPDEIHNTGVELIAQFAREMDAILRAEGLTQGSVAERVREISKRPDQLYPNTDAGREQILADLNAQTRAVLAECPKWFGVQARAPLEIKRVPTYIEAGAPGGYYQRAALDGSRPGQYYINLRDTAEWPRFSLPTLNFHEGVPGHHWQIAIQQESGSLPFIRNALIGFSAFSEGWGLYAEQLADEMGLYGEDKFGRLGRLGYLQSATFRASRLVVDTGMHAKRWSREQAIASMMEATGDAESSVITEIERYSVRPGQACAYMVGRQAILKMRGESQEALGARFDIKAFHDALLTSGSMPLSVAEGVVRDWAARTSA